MSTENQIKKDDNQELPISTELKGKVDKALEGWAVPTYKGKADAWKEIEDRIGFTMGASSLSEKTGQKTGEKTFSHSNKNKTKRLWVGLGIAASILIIMVFSIYWIGMKTYTTGYGQYTTYTLPDGSKAHLMPLSKIEYNDNFFILSRNIYMDGEVFFEVQKGEKFTVTTKNERQIGVLGTKFRVMEKPSFFEVFCTEGRVSVDNQETRIATLSPHQGVSVVKGEVTPFYSQSDNFIHERKEGVYRYQNAPLSRVIQDFSDVFHKKIIYQGDKKHYTGYFNKKDMKKALLLICEPYNFKYKIDGETITIGKRSD